MRNPEQGAGTDRQLRQRQPAAFNASDGSGYAFLKTQVLALDPSNPQVAARLLRAISRWRRVMTRAGELMKERSGVDRVRPRFA